MREGTLGRILVRDALPAGVPVPDTALDKKTTAALFQAIAEIAPEKYREVSKRLTDLGAEASYLSNGYSFGPHHLRPPEQVEAANRALAAEVSRTLADPTLTDAQRNDRLVHLGLAHTKPISDAVESSAVGNPLAMQVRSGAKGNAGNLKSILAGDTLYSDSEYNPVPYPITHSFYEGLRPHEYAAGTFGARLAITLTKLGTAQGGYFAKRLKNMAHRLVVTARDGEQKEGDPLVGYETPLDDPDNEGAVLAAPAAGFPRNTILTRGVIADLKRTGTKNVIVRSPIAGGPADGGVYGLDVGVRERGGVSPVGDQVGLAAAEALCLAEGTRVRMADGTSKAIEDVVPGEFVLGSDRNGTLRPVRVVNRYDNGVKPCYRSEFRQSTLKESAVLVSTLEHKILTVKDCGSWASRTYGTERHVTDVRPVGQLTVKGTTYAKTSSGYDDSGHTAEPMALLLGLLLGNGCYTKGINNKGVNLSCYDPTLIAEITDYLAALNLKAVPLHAAGEYRISDVASGKAVRGAKLRGIRNTARRKLVELGMWGKYAHEKSIPDQVHGWTNESVAALLSGLIATDGSVCPASDGVGHVVYFSSTSRKMVEQIKYLADVRFGVLFSSILEYNKPKTEGGFHRTQYSITLGSWESFQKLAAVLRVPGVKGARLAKCASEWKRASISRYVGRRRLGDRQYVGDLPTYDIEVDHPDHLFVLENGLIVSNSEPATQSIIGCLAAGTLVRMADGTTKTIESIVPGDRVLGADVDGSTAPADVVRRFEQGVKGCVSTAFRDEFGSLVFLKSTPDHKVLASVDDPRPDRDLQIPVGTPADRYTARFPNAADGSFRTCDRVFQQPIGALPTYDIEVDNADHLFVLANGLIVSNSKHSGGVVGSTSTQQGFPVLDKIVSVPTDYGGAVHARLDGVLSSIRDAPQGGKYVVVGGEEHYVPPDRKITVPHGTNVEAGDPLTDGTENPAMYVEHKGIGEARKRFVDVFMRAAKDAGFKPFRRNLELLARGFHDHVTVEKEFGDHVPGDVTSYTGLAADYEPREGHKVLHPKDAAGMYLERPALHYTIGTKVRPSVVEALQRAGIDRVPVHHEPPPFTPIAVRSHDIIGYDPDPMTRMLGSGLEKTLLRGVARGDVSDPSGTSFVPALAEGVNFGSPGTKTRGWEPTDLRSPVRVG